MNTVGELSILFGLQPKRAEWRRGEAVIQGFARMAVGLGAIFGAGKLGKALIGFNADIEDAKNQIAGMLALARKTDLNSQLEYANQLYDGLRKKAAELPGTTADYINMLGMLVQPMAKAGLDMQKMETLTVDTMVAARGLGENWQKASRDISEFINFGKFNAVDTFIRRIMGAAGYEADDATKKRLKAMSVAQRAEIAMAGVGAKAIKDLGDRQANSFRGQLDKVKEATAQFLGSVGLPLFKALGESIRRANKWLSENEKAVEDAAKALGGKLLTAFNAFKGVIQWILEHKDATISALFGITVALITMGIRAAVAWALTLGPLGKLISLISAGFYVFQKLKDYLGDIATAMLVAFSVAVIWKFIPAIKAATAAMANYGRTAAAASAAGAVGGVGGRAGGLAAMAAGTSKGGVIGNDQPWRTHRWGSDFIDMGGAGGGKPSGPKPSRWSRLSGLAGSGAQLAGRAFGVLAAAQFGVEIGGILRNTLFKGYFEEMARRRKFEEDLRRAQTNYTISELEKKMEEGKLIQKSGKTNGENFVNIVYGDTIVTIKGSDGTREEIAKEFADVLKEQRERMLRETEGILKGNKK